MEIPEYVTASLAFVGLPGAKPLFRESTMTVGRVEMIG
jgi:hypothetical protein